MITIKNIFCISSKKGFDSRNILHADHDFVVPILIHHVNHTAPFILIKKDDTLHCFSLSHSRYNIHTNLVAKSDLADILCEANIELHGIDCFGATETDYKLLYTQDDLESCMAIAISTIIGFLKSPDALKKLYEEIEKVDELPNLDGVRYFEMSKDLAKYIQNNAAAEAIARGKDDDMVLPITDLSTLGLKRKESHPTKKEDLGVTRARGTGKVSVLDYGPKIKSEKYQAIGNGHFDSDRWREQKSSLRDKIKEHSDAVRKKWIEFRGECENKERADGVGGRY